VSITGGYTEQGILKLDEKLGGRKEVAAGVRNVQLK
jgi:hypothetical protein